MKANIKIKLYPETRADDFLLEEISFSVPPLTVGDVKITDTNVQILLRDSLGFDGKEINARLVTNPTHVTGTFNKLEITLEGS